MNTNAFKLLSSAKLQTFLNGIINQGISRDRLVSIAIGKALSDTYSLSPNEINFDDYFTSMFKINASIILSDLNEVTIIDIDSCLEYTKKFLRYRYQALCGTDAFKSPIILTKSNAIYDLLGISLSFTLNDIELINSEFYRLTELVNGFRGVINDINSQENNNG